MVQRNSVSQYRKSVSNIALLSFVKCQMQNEDKIKIKISQKSSQNDIHLSRVTKIVCSQTRGHQERLLQIYFLTTLVMIKTTNLNAVWQ